ncbi:sigma-70 family RNA polymerase sigma factor [Ornithinibacillus caprae]|uniref:sigma-70 family RNA polymerase sigma factor n=1 Tax=Ornithinibacillus caprae TaxID=2678566 RepID=UPI0018C5A9FE
MKYEQLYNNYRSLAFSVAYQMIGSIHDAEDIVQEVYVQLNRVDLSSLVEPKAYLMKMVVNKCLNYLQSTRHKRKVYTGPWLPEPLIDIHTNELLNRLLKEESISYAFTVLLHNLTELERCVYILKKSLTFDYATISSILNRTEQSLRKVYSRANQKIESADKNIENKSQDTKLSSLFIEGAESGDFDPFIKELSENVVLITDGGGKVLAAIKPIHSKKNVIAFLQGIYKRGSFQGVLRMISVNGGIGVLQEINGIPNKAIMFDIQKEGITNIYFVMNPKKLSKIGHKLLL